MWIASLHSSCWVPPRIEELVEAEFNPLLVVVTFGNCTSFIIV
jgi:hypothetical protein